MNHKRGRPKNSRAGCLMCKPNKMNGWPKDRLGHTGYGKLRDSIHANQDLFEEEDYMFAEDIMTQLGIEVDNEILEYFKASRTSIRNCSHQ